MTSRIVILSVVLTILAPCCVQEAFAERSQAARLNNAGVALLGKNDFASAVARFEEALVEEPGYEIVRQNLATAYNNWALRSSLGEAADRFAKAMDLDPTNQCTAQNMAIAASVATPEFLEKFIVEHKNAVPTDAKASDFVRLGLFYEFAHDWKEARAAYQRAIALDSMSSAVALLYLVPTHEKYFEYHDHRMTAEKLREQNKFTEAIAEYKAAAKSYPERAEEMNNLAAQCEAELKNAK